MNKAILTLFVLLIFTNASFWIATAYMLTTNQPEINPVTGSLKHETSPLQIIAFEYTNYNFTTNRWQAINVTIQNTDNTIDQNGVLYIHTIGIDGSTIADNGQSGTHVTVPANQTLNTGLITLTWKGNRTSTQTVDTRYTILPREATP